jgi:hypothetical protein
VNQAPAYQQSSTNYSQLPLNNQAGQQKALHAQGQSSNVYSVNHTYENSQPTLQGSASMVGKVQIPTNPRIAPDVPVAMPRAESKLQGHSSLKPAYVGVSVPKNDVKAGQDGHGAATQVTNSILFVEHQLCYNHTAKLEGVLTPLGTANKSM